MNNTGDQYKNGYGVIQDYEIALDWYRQAAELGNAEAMKNIGNCYFDGDGIEQDYEKALEWYQKAADLGNADAINNIGNCYYFGDGVEQDSKKALELYQEAADLGSMAGISNLADAYFLGDGVAQDYVTAHDNYVKAAEMGLAYAMYSVGYDYNYGYGVEQNKEEALEWYQKAADLGNASAMKDIGNFYYNGEGVEQDYIEAFVWYQRAAILGNTDAMFEIGYLFDEGYGVEQNYEKALEWYQKAADLGNAMAMNNIALLYHYGDGVEQNYEKALEWYQKAADLGNANAMNNMALLYHYGDGVEQNYEKALEWYQKAADLGNANALNNIGVLYENGYGVEQDYDEAKAWYQKAADNGSKKASENLERINSILSSISEAVNDSVVTCYGRAQGIEGDIVVQVEADETTIYSVEILKQNETLGIGSIAVERLPDAIVAANTYVVDGVAGATITSTAIRDAVKMALESAGFDLAAYGAASAALETEEPSKADDTVYDVDVVVIGAGGAGMTAAITAADAGKNVLVLESQGMVGGNSVRSTGGMNAAPTEWQQANTFGEIAGVESTLRKVANYPDNARIQELGAIVAEQWAAYQANPDGYFDSAELFQLDTLIGGGGMNDPALVKRLVENSPDAIAWLEQLNPAIVLHNVAQFGGASVKRIHRPVDAEGKILSVGAYVVPLLQQNLEVRGIELLLNTTATEILMDNGEAVGVVAESADGTRVTVNAGSVVIATGGFGANNEMIASIRPELKGFITTNAPGIQGQGIQMAQAVGADTVNLDQIQLHPTVHVEGTSGVLITEGLRGDGAILVNQEGERFYDEVSTRDRVSAAEFKQTGGYAWLIVDSRMSDASNVIQGYISKGYAETGETYEALAEAIGAPAAVFAATMESWNACVAAKEDAEFGRVSFANPLDRAPYYAIKVQPGIHHTMGGIKINDAAQVIDTNGNVIPGLFAAGEVTGGVHGNNRLGGNAVADFVIFGRIAGSSAAGILPTETIGKEADTRNYIPGTYTGEGTGMGKVVVKVTVDEKSIKAVEIDGQGETPGIGLDAIPSLRDQVIAAQSAEIDGISGATLTSNAVRTAVKSALDQAVAEEATSFSLLCANGELEAAKAWLNSYQGEFVDRNKWVDALNTYLPFCGNWTLSSGDPNLISSMSDQVFPLNVISSKVLLTDHSVVLRVSSNSKEIGSVDFQGTFGEDLFYYTELRDETYLASIYNGHLNILHFDSEWIPLSMCDYELKA